MRVRVLAKCRVEDLVPRALLPLSSAHRFAQLETSFCHGLGSLVVVLQGPSEIELECTQRPHQKPGWITASWEMQLHALSATADRFIVDQIASYPSGTRSGSVCYMP